MRPDDVPADDDRELFVTAWCMDPRFINEQEVLFIPEPRVLSPEEAVGAVLPGLRYLVRRWLIAFQDWSTSPTSPGAGVMMETVMVAGMCIAPRMTTWVGHRGLRRRIIPAAGTPMTMAPSTVTSTTATPGLIGVAGSMQRRCPFSSGRLLARCTSVGAHCVGGRYWGRDRDPGRQVAVSIGSRA